MRTLADDTAGAGLLLLTPVEDQPVVHLPFLLQRRLFHLNLADAFLFDLKCLPECHKEHITEGYQEFITPKLYRNLT